MPTCAGAQDRAATSAAGWLRIVVVFDGIMYYVRACACADRFSLCNLRATACSCIPIYIRAYARDCMCSMCI